MRTSLLKTVAATAIVGATMIFSSVMAFAAATTYANFDFTKSTEDGGYGKSLDSAGTLASNDYITVNALNKASFTANTGVKITKNEANVNINNTSTSKVRRELTIQTKNNPGRLTLDWAEANKQYYLAVGNDKDGYTSKWDYNGSTGTLSYDCEANTTYTFISMSLEPYIKNLKYVEISTDPDVSVKSDEISVDKGSNETIDATIDNLGDYTFEWVSADESIATVKGTAVVDGKSTGTITGVSAGTTTVTARIMDGETVIAKADISVTVNAVTSVSGTVDSDLASEGDKVVFYDNDLKVAGTAAITKDGDVLKYDTALSAGTYNITLKSAKYSSAQYYINEATVTVPSSGTLSKNIAKSSIITNWDFTDEVLYFDNDANSAPKLYKAENAKGDTSIKGIIVTTGSDNSKFHINYSNQKAQVKNCTFKVPVESGQTIKITATDSTKLGAIVIKDGYAECVVTGETYITEIATIGFEKNSTALKAIYIDSSNNAYVVVGITEKELETAKGLQITNANGKVKNKNTTTVYKGVTTTDNVTINATDIGAKYVTGLKVTGVDPATFTIDSFERKVVTE